MAKIPTKTLIAMAGAAAVKARDYARDNPDKVGQALDRVESTVSSRTHGKYDAKLGKGSNALRSALGLSSRGIARPAVDPAPQHPAWDAPQTPPPPPPAS
ncbi:antitoxin [Oryzobacter telluris]|uniref:antitoxin n=1 Tax=Oryzobacter telluris TaxID=3149179 RepID=UPI00370CFC98